MNAVELARRAASGRPLVLVMPEGSDRRIVEAAACLRELGFVRPILLGERSAIGGMMAECRIGQAGIEVVDPAASAHLAEYAARYRQSRPGVSAAVARRIVEKPLYHGGMMTRAGHADAMVAGASCPTGRVIEAAMATIGLATGAGAPSSCFLVSLAGKEGRPDRNLVFADCAVNVEPDPEVLADIAIAAAQTLRAVVGEEPIVAFLSFSTHGSARHPLVERVRRAVAIARRRCPELLLDGEIQADAALSPAVAAVKMTSPGPVRGNANVLVFPDLNAANIGYKLVQYLGGAVVHGPLLQGFAAPVADLSRGATVDDIVGTALLTLARVTLP